MRLQSAKFNINQLQITKPKQSEMQPRRRSNSPKLQPIVRVVHCTPMARVTGCFVAEKIRGEFKELEDEAFKVMEKYNNAQAVGRYHQNTHTLPHNICVIDVGGKNKSSSTDTV